MADGREGRDQTANVAFAVGSTGFRVSDINSNKKRKNKGKSFLHSTPAVERESKQRNRL